MYRVVGILGCSDEKLWLEDVWIEFLEISGLNRIHVVDQRHVSDVESFDPEVTGFISSQNKVPDLPPLRRGVESLVQVTIEAKRGCTDLPGESQVVKPLLKCLEARQFSIRS